MKVVGFGLTKLSKVSPDKVKLAHPEAHIANSNMYMAPELYKNESFDKLVDVFSFGLILYEMIEVSPSFNPRAAEDVAKMICLEGRRPPLKNKSKGHSCDLKELIEECWDPNPEVRPPFSEIILRLNKLYVNYAKQGRWKDTFKLPWK